MEAVNGVSEGDKGAPPPPSPLTGCYLLIVIGEPHTDQHRDIILQRVAKGLLSWDVNDCLVDLEKELAIITEQALEGEEARYGERLIQYASENLVTEILIHPVVSTLAQCVRNLLSSFTRHRHIIHAGYTFAANGSWALQDGTFSLADFAEAFQEIEVQRVIRAYENGISLDLHCSSEGEWSRLPKEPFSRSCKVRVNPNDVLTAGSPSITSFINYVSQFLVSSELESLLESSDVVGNIRFSRPTLYVFPGGQGDAALFGINGFNMLLDGGFSRKACFWDFVRHLDRLDAVLMTRLNNSNVNGISAVLKRKKQDAVYPQIGHFFTNILERRALLSPDGDKDKDPLLINLLDEGQEIISNLRHLNLNPQVCYRDSEPINLYHKVGHGTLDMYVLSPAKDSKEVREFLIKWNSSDQKLFANNVSKSMSREFTFPVQNLVSICALLVWQPANPNDTITRILYPGSSPQKKIFEGLDRLKHLDFIRQPVCTATSLVPAAIIKTKQIKDSLLDKPLTKVEKKEKAPPAEKIIENKVIENNLKNGDLNGMVEKLDTDKTVKKSDSTESDKSGKGKKETKPAPKVSKRSDSQKRKPPTEKKASPTTPKKTLLDNKVNGDAKKSMKPSPTGTPAKSAKDANNRKVIESKIKSVPKKEPSPKPAAAEPKPKIERKPISRRPTTKSSTKMPISPLKKMNGIQKPDSLSRKGKLDKEGTTDSSTVSTPSADQDSILKKDISKLTPEELQQLKAQELADLKEEQEAVKEIEAVFRKGEKHAGDSSSLRKVQNISIEDKLEPEEYLIIEKEVIEQDSIGEKDTKEDETQKLARDSEESEKQRKLSSENIQEKDEPVNEPVKEVEEIEEEPKVEKEELEEPAKETVLATPEEKIDDKKLQEKEQEEDDNKEVPPESQPDEKVSANVESGATTTAPTLPEDERITLDEIKEDNGQVIEEKHVKEETKEKEVPVIQLPPKTFENVSKLPPVVGIRLDKQSHIRDIVKTPDEVADLPVHEEVDFNEYDLKPTDDPATKQGGDDKDGKAEGETEKQTKDTEEVQLKKSKDKEELQALTDAVRSNDSVMAADITVDNEKKEEEVVGKKELTKSPDEEKEEDEHELKEKQEKTEQVTTTVSKEIIISEVVEHLNDIKEEVAEDKLSEDEEKADEGEKKDDVKLKEVEIQENEKKVDSNKIETEIKKEQVPVDNKEVELKLDDSKDNNKIESKLEENKDNMQIETKIEETKDNKESESKLEDNKQAESKLKEVKDNKQAELTLDEPKNTKDSSETIATVLETDEKVPENKSAVLKMDVKDVEKVGPEKESEKVGKEKDKVEKSPKETADKELEDDKLKTIKDDVSQLSKLDEKLQELKEDAISPTENVSSKVIVEKTETLEHPEPVIIAESAPETPEVEDKLTKELIDKCELGRKSPKEREEDVLKIVTQVAEVLKSDAPLEEFEGKIPFALPPYTATYTTELRETHITTCDSPLVENKPIEIDNNIPTIPEEPYTPKTNESFDEEPKQEIEQKRSSLIKESQELMMATSKMISDIKSSKPNSPEEENKEDQDENKDGQEMDNGTVHRMLVTTSSEDGGEEIEICPPGTITFSRSSESSGRSSPDIQKGSQKSSVVDTISDTLSTVKQVQRHVEEEAKKEEVAVKSEVKQVEMKSSGKSTPEVKEETVDTKSPVDLSGKSTPDIQVSKEITDYGVVKSSGTLTPVKRESIDLKPEKSDVPEKSPSEKDLLKDDNSDISGKSTPEIGLPDTKVEQSGKSTPEVKESSVHPVDNKLSGKSTPDVGLTETETKLNLSGKVTPERKDSKDAVIEEKLSGKSTPDVGLTETKLDLSGKATPERKESKDAVIEEKLSGKSTPDVGLTETKLDLSGKETPERKESKDAAIEEKLSGKSTPDVGLTETKLDLSGKATPERKESKDAAIEEKLSGKSTPDVGLTETKLDLSGKATPERKESKDAAIEEKLSGKSTPNVGLTETKLDLSGKATPERKESKDAAIEEKLSGKSTPDVGLTETKLDLSGKATPERKESKDAAIEDKLSGKSTPDVGLMEAKLDLSGKATPERKESKDAMNDEKLSGKSTPDVVSKDTKTDISGKTTPEIKDEKFSGKSTPDVLLKESKIDLSGKSTPDVLAKELSSGKTTPDIGLTESKVDMSGKSTPEVPEIDRLLKDDQLSGKSTPDAHLKDLKTELSGKSTPDVMFKESGKSTPNAGFKDESKHTQLEAISTISGKSTPDSGLEDIIKSEKPETKETNIKPTTSATLKDELPKDTLPIAAKNAEKSPDVSGKSTPDSGLKDSEKQDLLKEETASDVSLRAQEKSPELSRKSSMDSGVKETSDEKSKDDLKPGSDGSSGKSTPDLHDLKGIVKEGEKIPEKSPQLSRKSTPELEVETKDSKLQLDKSLALSGKSTPDIKEERIPVVEEVCQKVDVRDVKNDVKYSPEKIPEATIDLKKVESAIEEQIIKDFNEVQQKRDDKVAGTEKSLEDNKVEDAKNEVTEKQDIPEKSIFDTIKESVQQVEKDFEETLAKTASVISETVEKISESVKSEEEKGDELLEKCGNETVETFDHLKDMSKSVLFEKCEETKEKVDAIKTSVLEEGEKVLKQSAEAVGEVTDKGKTALTEKYEDIVDKTKSTLNETLQTVTDIKETVTNGIADEQKKTENFLTKSVTAVKEAFEISEEEEKELEKKFSEVVEKETKEMQDTLENVKEMGKSVIFEKCLSPEAHLEKTFEKFVEEETKEISDTLQHVEEMGQSVVFGKCDKETKERERRFSEVVDKEVEEVKETLASVSDMSKSMIFEKCDHVEEKPGAITNGVGETVNEIIDEASDFINKTAAGLQQCMDMSRSILIHKEEEVSKTVEEKGQKAVNGVSEVKESIVEKASSFLDNCEKFVTDKTSDRKEPIEDHSKLEVGQSDAKKLSISDVEISIEQPAEPVCVKQASSSMLDAEKSLYGETKISDSETQVCDKENAQKADESKTAASEKPTDNTVVSVSIAGPSTTTTTLQTKQSTTEQNVSGKTTPDIADKEKHIPGKCTPPTVPVSPVIRDTTTSHVISTLKDSDLRSCTPGSDECDISPRNLYESGRIESDDDDMPGSPMSITSQVAHSRSSSHYDFEEDSKLPAKLDPMNMSLYGALPTEEEEEDTDVVQPTHLYEITKAKYSAGTSDDYGNANIDGNLQLDKLNQNGHGSGTSAPKQEDLMSASFIGSELPEPKKKDPIESWGKPLGLPSPAPPNNNQGTPKKEKKLSATVTAKNKLNDDKKRAESPSKYRNKKINPIYVDLTYVPHHGNSNYSHVEFFKRVRARYYVFSGIEPSREVYNALLEAKQTWEDKDLEVTIIPTYDTDILGYWVAENEELLSKYKIDLSPSASRCTINLQDHETSCSAYRLEF